MLTAKGYYKFNDQTRLDPSKLRSVSVQWVACSFARAQFVSDPVGFVVKTTDRICHCRPEGRRL